MARQQSVIIAPATPVANYQVEVTITSQFNYGVCQPGGADIRFTEFAGDDPAVDYLDHWIEDWNDGGTSTVYVKVPTLGATEIFLNYEEPAWTSVSDIDATMEANTVRFQYYTGTNFNTYYGTDLCALPNTSWGGGVVSVCGVGVASDSVSVSWEGWLLPDGNGTYTFFGYTDDGGRTYIDGGLVQNDWSDHGPRETSGTYAWSDGLPRSVVFQFYENGGGADAAIGWTTPNTAKAYPVPTSKQRGRKAINPADEPVALAGNDPTFYGSTCLDKVVFPGGH
jgi:hypothetical protein